jgi:CubicO group peptidase (beta-lactamase class C family)
MKRNGLLYALTLVFLLISCSQAVIKPVPPAGSDREIYVQFEAKLEYLRQELKIPGFSAAIVKDQELVWAKGFGYADLNPDDPVEATPDTPYRLASVTKPIAATLIMGLVEEGVLDLDDPVSKYGIDLQAEGVVRVRHLLTHTSEGVPGTHHNYSGDRYGLLGQVVKGATGVSFRELLRARILEPLEMANTAPNYPSCELERYLASSELERDRTDARVNRELARPYQLDPSYSIVAGAYPSGFTPAAGLISTVVDLAKFDIALDQNILLSEEMKEKMFAPAFSTHGDRADLMYGLGWYTQEYQDMGLIWHSGRWPPSVSALYLKAPDENITFILLANTAHLTTPYPLGDGDVLYSTLALTLYETFLFPRQFGKNVPEVNWEADRAELEDLLEQIKDEDVRSILERELWSYRQLFASVGRTDLAGRLWNVHRQAYPNSRASDLDQYTFDGVAYYPPAEEGIELSERELSKFVGALELDQWEEVAAGAVPPEITLELVNGKLIATAPGDTCISLVPVGPTRFAIPENPGVILEAHMDGDRLESMALQAGDMVAAVYTPKR